MAAPVIYILGGVIVRAATPAISKRLVAAGFRKASPSIVGSKANITTATNSNIISLITRAIKGARTSTSGRITRTPPNAKPKSAREVREALKRNAEKVSSRSFGKKKLSDYGTVGSAPKAKPASSPLSFSRSVSKTAIPMSITPPEREAAKAPSVKEKPVAKPGEAIQSKVSSGPIKGKTVQEIKKIAEKALDDVDREDAALLKMEAKYLPSSINKLKSSLRPRARPATVKKTLSAFEKAFKAARKAKKYSFPFRGKEYTTRYKEETVAEHKKKFPKKKKK